MQNLYYRKTKLFTYLQYPLLVQSKCIQGSKKYIPKLFREFFLYYRNNDVQIQAKYAYQKSYKYVNLGIRGCHLITNGIISKSNRDQKNIDIVSLNFQFIIHLG